MTMSRELNFTDTKENKLFVTGCPHLGHNPPWEVPIYVKRGYTNHKDMTDAIIQSFNDICTCLDTLMVLGDFCLNVEEDEFLRLIGRIHPKLWFVRGNHNNPWEGMYLKHCKEAVGYEMIGYEWLDKITYYGDYIDMKWNKRRMICFHYPISVWDRARHNAIHLCSHSHHNFYPSLPSTKTEGKIIDCGWDGWRKPIGFEEIMRCANQKEIVKKDHH